MSPPLLEALSVTNLCTAFGDQVLFSGIDLRLAVGETLVILGRSGTGKSVLLRHLVGLRKPDSGSIRLLGQELAQLDTGALSQVRKRVGFVFQNAALYDSLTVAGNVEFPLRFHTTLTVAERREGHGDPGPVCPRWGFGAAAHGPLGRDAEAGGHGPGDGPGPGGHAV
jgi:phospholipid/cholesterol/gamma-HCH transport system ATP-binding protein